MASYSLKSVHVDKALTAYATAYTNNALIADRLAPVMKVDNASDRFYRRPKANMQRVMPATLGLYEVPPEIDTDLEQDSYLCRDYGRSGRLALSIEANADIPPLNLRQELVADLTDQVLLEHEVRVEALLANATNYASGNTVALTTGNGWNNNSVDPLATLFPARSAVRRGANSRLVAFCGIGLWNTLRRNTSLLNRVTGGAMTASPGMVTRENFAQMIEVDEFVVGEAYKTTSNPGQAANEARVWGDSYFGIVAVSNAPSTRSLEFVKTFRWQNPTVYTDIDMKPGLMGSYFVKVTHSEDIKLIASDAGYLVTNCLGALFFSDIGVAIGAVIQDTVYGLSGYPVFCAYLFCPPSLLPQRTHLKRLFVGELSKRPLVSLLDPFRLACCPVLLSGRPCYFGKRFWVIKASVSAPFHTIF